MHAGGKISKNEKVERLEILIGEANAEVVEARKAADKEASRATSLQQQLDAQEERGELTVLRALDAFVLNTC